MYLDTRLRNIWAPSCLKKRERHKPGFLADLKTSHLISFWSHFLKTGPSLQTGWSEQHFHCQLTLFRYLQTHMQKYLFRCCIQRNTCSLTKNWCTQKYLAEIFLEKQAKMNACLIIQDCLYYTSGCLWDLSLQVEIKKSWLGSLEKKFDFFLVFFRFSWQCVRGRHSSHVGWKYHHVAFLEFNCELGLWSSLWVTGEIVSGSTDTH